MPQKNSIESKEPKLRMKKRSKVRSFFRVFFIVILTLTLIGIISVGGVAGYTLMYVNSQVNGDILIDLNEYRQDQSQTTILYYYDANNQPQELARLHGEVNRVWVAYDDIPENLKKAYIALEDKRFWEHEGVDWVSTIGIVVRGGFKRGGSTIDQQLIKNLTGESGRTFSRKFNEIIYAMNMEKNFSKKKILETYLNTLYLDAGCYGVQTAANYYFGKDVADLNLAECACIAAITKAPRAYNPIINPENNEERRIDCLYFMREQGLISETEYREALDYKLEFVGNFSAISNTTATTNNSEINSFYVDYVIDQLMDHFQREYDMSASQAYRKVYYGGLRVYTCVDMRIQEIMEDVYENRYQMGKDEDLQSAMAMVDYDGQLVGIVGMAGEKTANRSLNIASDSPRQPGSAIKPLSVYAPGIDGDFITWSSMVQDYGFMVDGKLWPYNYGGNAGSGGFISVKTAIVPSYNTVPAQLVRYLGMDYCYEYLTEKFHLTHLSEADIAYAPLACGGMSYGVTCLEMAAAFSTFGNGGVYYEPAAYSVVTSSDGGKIWIQRDMEGEQAIEPGTADVMQELLKTTVYSSNGTARKCYVDGFDTFAKTGTTTDNKDSWFAGGTAYYCAAVWYGYAANPRELKNIGGGNSPSGRMFKTVMDRVHEGLDPTKEFYKSGEAETRYYCTVSGLLAGSGCASTAKGWFKSDSLPQYCSGCYVHDGISAGVKKEYFEPTSETETISEEETEVGENDPTKNETPTEKPTANTTSNATKPTETPVTNPPATQAPTTTPSINIEPDNIPDEGDN
jgi:penicillin-binding protein 1A